MVHSLLFAGFMGGVVMSMWAMMMHFTGLSAMNMVGYAGCMITGQRSGVVSFLMGMAMHFILSLLIAFMYAQAFFYLWGSAGLVHGLCIGVIHWLIAGMMLPVMDRMNACVTHNQLPALGSFAHGYGMGAVTTFFVGHLLYGAVVGYLL